MAMKGSLAGPQKWISEYDTYKRHRFDWSASISGYTATINWSVVCEGTDTQSVNQHCYLTISTGGKNIYSKKSARTNWNNWSSTGEGYSGWTLLSGSFTLTASYNTGVFPSFSVGLQSAIFYGTYQGGTATNTFTVDSKTITLPAISSITDNGNNTITVNFSKGNLTGDYLYLYLTANRDENPTADYYDYYESFKADIDSYSISLGDIGNISSSSGKKTKNNIKAKIYRYNSDYLKSGDGKSKDVYYYKAPSNPGKPYISATDNKYGKYSISSRLTFKWDKPSTGCDGYRIRVWINGKDQNVYDSSGKYIGTYYDVSGDGSNSFTVDCNKYALNPGDTLKLGVYAYTLTGSNDKWWSGGESVEMFSDAYTIVADKNFVAHVKVDSNNKVSENGTWKTIKVMHIRDGWNTSKDMREASFIYGRGVTPWK